MVDSLTRPNGIAFLPGEQTVIIANSDPFKPYWYAYDIDASGNFTNGRIFHSAAGNRGEPGLPDGLKVDKTVMYLPLVPVVYGSSVLKESC